MPSIGVYIDDHPTGLCRQLLSTYPNLPISIETNPENYYFKFKNQFQEFIDSKHDIKFASFHISWPYTYDWIKELKILQKQVDHVFVISTELHDVIEQCLCDIDLPNISIFLGGIRHTDGFNAQSFLYFDWFKQTVWVWTETNSQTLLTDNSNGKNKYFDILLGARRVHRDFVYEYCKQNNLFENNFVTYYQSTQSNLATMDKEKFTIGNKHINFINPVNHTVRLISYQGIECPLCLPVPYEIYNQSYYTLVAETNTENHFNFYTEKIAKPILARRLFIVIAGRHYLKNLQSLGFKTFNNVISEEYDNEENHINRWQMAMEQVEFLNTQDPQYIYDQINDIIEHNYNHMVNTNWEKPAIDRIKFIVGSLL